MATCTRQEQLNSLRARYTLFALLVVVLVLFGSSFAFLSLLHNQDQAGRNLEIRSTLSTSIHGVRAGLVEAYKSLDLFLLEPGAPQTRETATDAVTDAVKHSRILRASEWVTAHGQRQTAERIEQRLTQLSGEIGELMATRVDPGRQYPSMALANNVMQPNRDIAENAFTVIFHELAMDQVSPSSQVYDLFATSQRLWMQMLSNFRLYLANRVGSFDEVALPRQEEGIITTHSALQELLDELFRLDEAGVVGFESGAALVELQGAVDTWFEAFQAVRDIHSSDRWRMDAVLMKEKIAPSVDAINSDLLVLEDAFSETLSADVAAIANAASRLAWILWLVAGLSVLFILLVVMTTDRLVFRPIAAVARALKAEALGGIGVELPASRTRETQDLVDAFGEMRRQVRVRQAELEHRALHDALTTLPNRTLLLERIQYDIQLARRQDLPVSLLVLDLDRFKEVNDTLGHSIGDELLVEVGERLRGCLRESDTVARLGGDEFAILLPATGAHEATATADKLLATFETPINLRGIELYAGASIGIALYPAHGDEPQTLMQHADVAMYMAKRARAGYAVYDPDKDEYTLARLAMITDLRQAVEHDQLELHYQPILSITSGEPICVEALLRWEHPVHGRVSPELVVELAEQTRLIAALTQGVIDRALAQIAHWRRQGRDLCVSVNLSMYDLHDGQLADKVQASLRAHDVPGRFLTLEVTESAMMANPRQVMSVLNALDEVGVRLAVDDFGTGFSSLAYLKSLPVDILKIDKSFVIDLDQDRSDQAIVQATISLGHSLGLEVVAEGIENARAWDMLHAMGCNAGQGFHMSRPLTPAELEHWLQQRNKVYRSGS